MRVYLDTDLDSINLVATRCKPDGVTDSECYVDFRYSADSGEKLQISDDGKHSFYHVVTKENKAVKKTTFNGVWMQD